MFKEGYTQANEWVRELETQKLKQLVHAVNYWTERYEESPHTFQAQLVKAQENLVKELQRLGKLTSDDYLNGEN